MQVLGYTGNEDGKKFVFDGEVTVDKIKVLFFSLSLGSVSFAAML